MARLKTVLLLLAALFPVPLSAGDQKPPWIPRKDLPESRALELAAGIGGKVYVLTSGEEGTGGGDVFEYDPTTDTWTKRAGAPSRRCAFGGAVVDGRIYIWGGATSGPAPGGDTINDTVEVYDPAKDAWSVKQARMPAPRLFAKGAAVNGKLYAVGGVLLEGGATSRAVHEYDPRSDRWTERSPMGIERRVYRVAGAGGRLYAIGGYTDAYADLLVEEYDAAADRWTRRPNTLSRAYDNAVATMGDEIWVTGSGSSAAVHVYAPRSDQWSKRPDLPDQESNRVAAVVNGRLYAINGWNRKVYEYNPAGKEYVPAPVRRVSGWQKKADMPAPRQDHFAVTVGHKVYILGGRAKKDGTLQATSAVDVYDSVLDQWTAAKPVPESINKAVAVDGRIYAFGRNASYQYDPATDAWTGIAPVPTPRGGFAVAAVDGKVYVMGGMLSRPTHRWGWRDGDMVEEYNPKTNQWVRKANLLAPGHAFTAVTVGSRIYLLGGHKLEVYDPAADSWTKAAPVPIFVAYFGAFESKGKIFVLPGMLATTWAMQEYDPSANAWRVLAAAPHSKRRLYAAASANAKVYTFGGIDSIDWDDWTRPVLALTEEFTPE